MESKIKIEHLESWIKESKIILKQYEKDKNRLVELEKIYNQCQNLKNENKNILKDIEKIKNEKNLVNKQNVLQKDLLEKYKNMNNDLDKKNKETKINIDKLNKEINELKFSKSRLKSENKNIQIKDESAHKLRKIIESLKKQNKDLELENKELLKRLEIKEKTGKTNKILLDKERRIHKFENLHKINVELLFFKKKSRKDRFKMPNNIEIITNRLYPKNIKTTYSTENNNKPIIINKDNLELKNINSAKIRKIKKETKKK